MHDLEYSSGRLHARPLTERMVGEEKVFKMNLDASCTTVGIVRDDRSELHRLKMRNVQYGDLPFFIHLTASVALGAMSVAILLVISFCCSFLSLLLLRLENCQES